MRKAFTTTIDKAIVSEFRKKCAKEGLNMNDVLEVLMAGYSTGQLNISFSYKIAASQTNSRL